MSASITPLHPEPTEEQLDAIVLGIEILEAHGFDDEAEFGPALQRLADAGNLVAAEILKILAGSFILVKREERTETAGCKLKEMLQ